MFFDTVALQAISRRFHRHVDDALLDRCAAECGCTPIGRLCLLGDDVIAEIAKRCKIESQTRVLDFGCGRGFLGRWLAAMHIEARYFGIDRNDAALEAARVAVPNGSMTRGDFRTMRRRPRFDVVTGLEIAIDGAVDDAVFEAAASALKSNGAFVLTFASLDRRHPDRLEASAASAQRHFACVKLEDWTGRVEPFARRMYAWWRSAPWGPEIAEQCRREAIAALDALERGGFHYAVLFARK